MEIYNIQINLIILLEMSNVPSIIGDMPAITYQS